MGARGIASALLVAITGCDARTTSTAEPSGAGGEETGGAAGKAAVGQPVCGNQKGFYEDGQGTCRRFRPCDDSSDCAAYYECKSNPIAGHDTCAPIATCEVPSRPDPDVICASVQDLKQPRSDPYPRAKHPERLGEECPAVADVEFAPEPSDACRVVGECGPVVATATDGQRVCCYAGPSRCGPTLP